MGFEGLKMSEALARQVEDRPVERLLTLYADGSDEAIAGAHKLTLEMIAKTAEWFDGKGDPRGPELVRRSWINQIRRAGAEVDAEVFDRRWAAAFAKANRQAILAESRRS
jgi:hypothetical protein